MSDSPWVVVPITIGIIFASGLFVAIEFSLMAAKRHRFEDAAATSRTARAALRNASELTLLLAGAQLGITVCTLALGAITKPAVHHWLTPAFEAVGLPAFLSDVLAFILALFIVTFLHLVIGEMAPKSWAIAHPERSAMMLSIPMRGFMWLTRPLLRALNAAANRLLHLVGVEPVDQRTTSQTPDDLRQLVRHSVDVGSLDLSQSEPIAAALEMQTTPLGNLIHGRGEPTQVPMTATMGQVRDASCESGHLRILMNEGGQLTRVVHVRDTLAADDDAPAVGVSRPVFTLAADCFLHEALTAMRQTRNHLAVVINEDGSTLGVVTMADILRTFFPTGGAPLPVS
jgi:CBS domain containing-hemolysin-like protein